MREYKDFYFRKAKQENLPARSVYKLREIDSRFHLLRKGARVFDMGASPGSWTLEAAEKVGSGGFVASCDLKSLSIQLPEHVVFSCSDIFNLSSDFSELLKSRSPFDLVMSDMAPATTGSRFTDQAKSFELAWRAHELADVLLRPGGNFIVKIFMGPDVKTLMDAMRSLYDSVRTFKPKSSRSESKETFILGLKRKLAPESGH